MRVALIPTPKLRSEWGSTLHAVLLAERLAAAGADVHVYCLDHPAETPGTARFHDLPLPLAHPVLVDAGISDAQLMACTTMLAEAIVADHTRAPFDVIHAHYATVTAFAGLTARTVCGAPLVVSSFGRDLNVGAARDARYERMAALTLSQAQAVIAGSEGVARRIAEHYRVPESRLFTIPMGIDPRVFAPRAARPDLRAALAKDGGHLIVNISSCFGVEKGIEVLLQATRILIDGGLRLSLAIVGEDDYGDRREEQRLRRLAADLGLESVVTFVGRIRHQEIPEYLAAADLVVDPRLVGSFSSAVLEALFSGAWVVASDVPNNRLWFADGRAGVMHRAGDAADLARAMTGLLTDPQLREQIAASVAAWRMDEGAALTADRMADQTLEIYRRVAHPLWLTPSP